MITTASAGALLKVRSFVSYVLIAVSSSNRIAAIVSRARHICDLFFFFFRFFQPVLRFVVFEGGHLLVNKLKSSYR